MRVRFLFSSRHTKKIDVHNKHRQEYPALAKEVIAASDVVLEVLDARFIGETRNFILEEYAREQGKLLVYVINKIDLANAAQLEESGLLDELQPYIFLSAVKHQGRKQLRDTIKIQAKRFKRAKKIHVGEPAYSEHENLEIHKQGVGYRKFLKVGTQVHVGVIGYPNVGKSSIINMLTGRGAARTSPRAGFTRGIQKVKLADGIILLDTPGVMSDEDAAASQAQHLKKHAMIGVRTYDSTKNPDFVAAEIMQDNPGLFEEYYGIAADGDSEVLLETLGKQRRFLLKGGAVDLDRTARTVLKDWQNGKIAKGRR